MRPTLGDVSEPLVLGIESTCDETGVGLVRGTQLLVDRTATSMDEYARYGGIIPEIASRAHLESFLPTLHAALDEAGVTLADVDAIAVAAGPGLVGSLTVGICAAKALASSLGKPLYGVNHVIGHLAVDKLAEGPLPDHFIGLVVSGGHSNILEIRNIATDVVELGGTLDDAAGEAFDKVGRLLDLPYPGGPHVDRLSQQGDREAIRFPRGLAAGRASGLGHRVQHDRRGRRFLREFAPARPPDGASRGRGCRRAYASAALLHGQWRSDRCDWLGAGRRRPAALGLGFLPGLGHGADDDLHGAPRLKLARC